MWWDRTSLAPYVCISTHHQSVAITSLLHEHSGVITTWIHNQELMSGTMAICEFQLRFSINHTPVNFPDCIFHSCVTIMLTKNDGQMDGHQAKHSKLLLGQVPTFVMMTHAETDSQSDNSLVTRQITLTVPLQHQDSRVYVIICN